MSFKATPAPKCVSCNESVYPMEKIDYDGQTFHTNCFKCLHCRSTVSLKNVAMIKGDLYCKTCFMKIFKREGKYSSFENPKASPTSRPMVSPPSPAPTSSTPEPSTPTAASASASTPTSAAAPKPTPTNGLPPKASPSSSARTIAPKPVAPAAALDPLSAADPDVRRRSTILLESCVADDCELPRVSRFSYCAKHGGYDSEAAALLEAVEKRDVSGVKNVLQSKSAGIIFKTSPNAISPLEMAFAGLRNSRDCGRAMVVALKSYIETLENDNQSLKQQQGQLEQALAKHLKSGGSSSSDAPNSAAVTQLEAENKALKDQQSMLEQTVAKLVNSQKAATPGSSDSSAALAQLESENKALREQQSLLEQTVAKLVNSQKVAASAPAPAPASVNEEVAKLQAENEALKEMQNLLEQSVAKNLRLASEAAAEQASLRAENSALKAAAAASTAATPAPADQSAELAALQAENEALKDEKMVLELVIQKQAAQALAAAAAAPAVESEVAQLQAENQALKEQLEQATKAAPTTNGVDHEQVTQVEEQGA